MNTLSIVISTRNRADSLKRCLDSIVDFADEIIIVDNQSTDNTKTVAEKYTKKIFTQQNNLMLNVNKNYGISKAMSDWILYLDDDEEVSQKLGLEIRKVISNSDVIFGYWIPRKNIIFGAWIKHGLWSPDYQLRLFRKSSGKYMEKHVHEHMVIDGRVEHMKELLVHYNYDSLHQYLEKMQNIYIESEVKKIIATAYKVQWYDAIRFPLSDFLKIYFAQSGYKDGLHGLVLAQLQSFYSFLVFVRLWEQSKFQEISITSSQIAAESVRTTREHKYWLWDMKLHEADNHLNSFIARIMRKFYSY